ncbi:hypothetical protein JRQ81_012632 [Phrynocephalus forsythii]|uniref:Uncharacterized protein n=1 Tax=Phrynocephalus forsythii TaxID=171643 RepID=A0A9Q0Y464_9SAUR|nr:hypothetical protein JRQ81_012632 [Phrynocephalus forsythii]
MEQRAPTSGRASLGASTSKQKPASKAKSLPPPSPSASAMAAEKWKNKRPKPQQNTPSPAHSASTAASMPQEHLEDDQIPSRQPSTLSPTSARSSTWGEDSHDLSTVVEVPLSPFNIQDLTSDLPIRMPHDTQAHRPPMSASMPRADAAPASTIMQEPPRTKAQAKCIRLPADAKRSRTPGRNDRPRERDDHSRRSCCTSPSTSPPRRCRRKHRRHYDSDSDSSSSYRRSRRRHRRRHRSPAHRRRHYSTSLSDHSADTSPPRRHTTSVDAGANLTTDVERPTDVECPPTPVDRTAVDRSTAVDRAINVDHTIDADRTVGVEHLPRRSPADAKAPRREAKTTS